jgi:hypothetical protein
MAIQDDFTIDYVDRKITYTTAFVDGRPPNIYTVNALYSWLQDTFDEPAQMDDPVPMTAQTPTQYTLINKWFMDNESMKALYSGSIQTSGWTKSGAEGITALRWQNTPTVAPDSGDIGEIWTGGTSTATGVVLAVDTARQVAWVRNTSAAQFQNNEAVTGPATDPNFNTMVTRGFQTGESIWTNLFSVGTLQTETEVYVGQEDDQLGGTAYHDADADSRFERRIEKLAEWWDSDVDFTASTNGVAAGHIDLLVLTQELGTAIDSQKLAVYGRQHGKVYSHFEFTGGVGNFVVPFASTGADLNAADGPYNIGYDAKAGGNFAIGDVLENDTGTTPVGRLRAVITGGGDLVSAAGDIDFYLIGENEANGTLNQFANNDNIRSRTGGGTPTADIDTVGTALSAIGPGAAQGITVTFADAQVDVDEDGTDEEYACTINCNSVALAEVYKRVQFLTCRGNQDGTGADTDAEDTLLPGGGATSEGGEFYRAIGDIIFNYDGGQGTQPTEGDLVTNGSGAYGVVTSITAGTTGVCVLTQVKGTWAENNTVAEIDAAASNDVTINEPVTGPVPVVDNTAAPFGTFAGGRWFVAQGVVLTNVPAADANNWQTTDLAGVARQPPTTRSVTFDGLVADVRAGIFEVATAGGIDIVKTTVGLASGAVGSSLIVLDSAVQLDVPPTGWIRVVDTDTAGKEERYEYSSISGTPAVNVNLRTVSPGDDIADAGGTATLLNDTNVGLNFGTDGNAKVGHQIRNVTDSSEAVILRRVTDNQIETTPLTGGTSNDWATGDAYEINTVAFLVDAADTCYFPYIDDTATGTSIAKTVKFVATTELVARARFSDPDVGGQRRIPFLTVTATLTDDDIAT